MTAGDVPAAASVGAEVGWPGREDRFGFYVRHPFCEALAAEVGGEVAGVGFGTRSGTRSGAVGWIGLVCVRPRYQGRGIGHALTGRVAERLEGLGCRTLVLTATETGRPLYEKMGFETETYYPSTTVSPGRGSVRNRPYRVCDGCVRETSTPSASSTAA